MNFELNEAEYKKLIELVYLGEWMINAQHDPEFQDEEATGLLQRLLRAHPIEDIDQDAETGDYFMHQRWTERLFDEYIADYDDHTFWDELTERLAQRDLARRRGVEPDAINRDDDLLELKPIEERYRRELEEHGLDRLDLHTGF